jgi:hypothetical protein
MKDEWENQFKLKHLEKTGFKGHQAYASQIIKDHAKRRFNWKSHKKDKPEIPGDSMEQQLLKSPKTNTLE